MKEKKPPPTEPLTPPVLEENEVHRSEEPYILRLYIAGLTARSTMAVERIKSICDRHLVDRHELIIIDLYLHPEQAQQAQIVVVPTLVKQLPTPVRLFVGDMGDTKAILQGLGIAT